MASRFDIVEGLKRRFSAHVEVRMDSVPLMVYFLDGDTHWMVDLDTGQTYKPLPSGRVIVGHPEALKRLYERLDVTWPSVEKVVVPT